MNSIYQSPVTSQQPHDARGANTLQQMLENARVKEAALLKLLATLEARLGTAEAQPNDFEAIIECIHQLMSVLQIYMGIPCEETARAEEWMIRRKRLRDMSKQ